jgi:hypothetical protein
MQRLRHARFLARLVLVWFALAIGAAVAAPIVQSGSLELVCSGSGTIKLLVKGDDGSSRTARHTLDCPLCVPMGAPPPAAGQTGLLPLPLAGPIGTTVPTRIALRTAAALPARGPPSRA